MRLKVSEKCSLTELESLYSLLEKREVGADKNDHRNKMVNTENMEMGFLKKISEEKALLICNFLSNP